MGLGQAWGAERRSASMGCPCPAAGGIFTRPTGVCKGTPEPWVRICDLGTPSWHSLSHFICETGISDHRLIALNVYCCVPKLLSSL